VKEYYEITAKQPDVAIAVAAIRALTSVIANSGATTMMGLERELKEAAAALQRWEHVVVVYSVMHRPA
jgi:translation initiation factor eIF-2B subunit alpha